MSPTPCQRCNEKYPFMAFRPYYNSQKRMYFYFYCSDCQELLKEENRLIVQDKKIEREAQRVQYHNERAREHGSEATLTLLQWLQTLERFNWHCAYCEVGLYEALEHREPIHRGGATSALNCVPACKSCNSRKGILHPDEIKESSLSPAAHKQVDKIMKELHRNHLSTENTPSRLS